MSGEPEALKRGEVQSPRSRPIRPKVMFVINSLAGGGAEKVLMTLLRASEHRAQRFAISLTLLDDDPSEAFEVPEWLSVRRLDCRYRTISSLRRLRHHILRSQPDIVVSFLTRSNVATWFAMRGRKKPWIISERINTKEQLDTGLRGVIARMLVRVSYPKASRLIAVSKGVAKTLEQDFAVPPEKIEVISNPVDTSALRGGGSIPKAIEGPYLVAVGRLVPMKNHSMLMRAFANSDFQGKLVIVGEGPERFRLLELASQLGVADRTIFTGYVSDPHRLMKHACLYVSASRGEGFPNALVESLALKVPVVATNCRDGPAEILLGKTVEEVDGTNVGGGGILTPIDDLEALTSAINLAITPSMRTRLLREMEGRTVDLSPEDAAARYWASIEQVLDG